MDMVGRIKTGVGFGRAERAGPKGKNVFLLYIVPSQNGGA